MAGFDAGAVYSTNIGHQDTPSGAQDEYSNNVFIKRKFKEFIKQFNLENYDFAYRDQLRQNYSMRKFALNVQVEHIKKFSKSLYEELLQRPSNIIELFEAAATEVLDDITRPRPELEEKLDQIQVLLQWDSSVQGLRDLRSDVVASLVRIQGIVTSVSARRSKATSVTLQCRNCRSYLPNLIVKPGLDGLMLPRRCQSSVNASGTGVISLGAADGRGAISATRCPLDPYIILPDKCCCVDYQILKLQESPENVPQGEMPRTVQLYLDRYLCDKVVPGNRVNIVGIYLIKNASSSKSETTDASGVRQAYVRILGIEQSSETGGPDLGMHSASTASGGWTSEQEEEFRRIAQSGNVYDLLSKSIAPSIYGSTDIKKAIACMLIGGSKKRLPDGLTRRGDINLLLLGDPGTAKSQLLKFVERAAPIGVYTSGKGSSAAGLTASVIRDPVSRTFVMEGGAMVLADGGVVCIDEFDKMREDDRVAIHEAMEQQTISIAKAGITTTLNTRCSVFAAANSVYGRWDDTKGEENIDFMPTILSRFDMIFVVKDEHDLERDTILAMHVMKVHLEGSSKNRMETTSVPVDDVFESGCQELSLHKLQQFIAYCRQRCGPRLSESAAQKLRAQYVLMRAGAGQMEEATGRRAAIPLTVRQLEAVIRISESLAKMRLAAWAVEADVEEAIRLFSVSTLAAANTGHLDGAEGFTSVQEQEKILRIERLIKSRFLVGSQVSEQAILQDFSRKGYDDRLIGKVITLMLRRGELQHRMQRRILYRVK